MSESEQQWYAAHPWMEPAVYGLHGMGGYAAPPGPKSPSKIADPDEPTVEEIAHAANSGFLPLKHRAAYAKARAEKRAVLVAEGKAISQCPQHRDETLIALAQIVRIGTGR